MQAVIGSVTSGVPAALIEIRRLGRTLKQRAADILAFFDRPGTSNGPTEAINGRLEHLRGTALGFRNLSPQRRAPVLVAPPQPSPLRVAHPHEPRRPGSARAAVVGLRTTVAPRRITSRSGTRRRGRNPHRVMRDERACARITERTVSNDAR